MGNALLNSVMAVYGENLTSSGIIGGYLVSIFTITALIGRLFIKKLNERFSSKALLVASMVMTVVAAAGYVFTSDIHLFMFFRGIHGIAFGVGLTCSTAISNEGVPEARLSEGVGYTSAANTVASAIGPTIALSILGKDYHGFANLFLCMLVIAVTFTFLSLFLTDNSKVAMQNRNVVKTSYIGIILAGIMMLGPFAQGTVNVFLTSYARKIGLGNVGPFFTIVALVALISRIFWGKIQEKWTPRQLTYIGIILFGLSIMFLSQVKSLYLLYSIAIPYGFAIGILYPIYNYRIVKTVDLSQIAFATSIYYCSADIGFAIGATCGGWIANLSNCLFGFVSYCRIDCAIHACF